MRHKLCYIHNINEYQTPSRKMNGPVLIQDFGNNKECVELSDLKDALINNYLGKHVTLVDTLPSGVKRSLFVKVNEDGSISGSNSGLPISFSELNINASSDVN